MDCSPPGSSVHGIFPGKNTGAGYHFLLHIHNGILFNHKNKRKIYHLAQRRWTLKALCKVKCQTKKNKYCVISLMCAIKKKNLVEKEIRLVVARGGGWGKGIGRRWFSFLICKGPVLALVVPTYNPAVHRSSLSPYPGQHL